ncbi:MAG: AMP-binding protein [Verrucomicrobiota bacterium]|jgi:acyl-[acyl-carrier-protein]-phospholipid O-acyltransferase/long-chain-fatty-acid--[acyl-carrier-protein] ligase|nr:AMP-binding protein [Verrucomicrobiota bacterium]
MDRTIRVLLKVLLRLLFGYKVYGKEHLKAEGPAILVPNHVSWLDWLFLVVILEEDWLFVTSSITARTSWLHKKVMVNKRTMPIDPASPYAVKHVAEVLSKKGRVVIFAEGRLSLTGELMKTLPGVSFLIQKTEAKIILGYLRGARYLKWVKHKGHTRLFPRVTLHLDVPLKREKFKPEVEARTFTTEASGPQQQSHEKRAQVTSWLRHEMLEHQLKVNLEHGPQTLPEAVRSMYGLLKKKVVWKDFKHNQLTYKRLVLGSKLLGDVFKKRLTASEEGRIGFLLPSVNSALVTLQALWSIGKVPTLLNFSAGIRTILDCAKLAKLRQIVTSRSFVKQINFDIEKIKESGVEVLYLEDIASEIPTWKKVLYSICPPRSVPPKQTHESTAVILFTSGSEGTPKAVELSHRNLIANCEQAVSFVNLADSEKIFNALPIFHGFGLMLGVVVPLVRGIYCFNYPSPLHFRVIPTLIYDSACTIFPTTNTFLNGYAHHAHSCDFESLRVTIAGAEKLQPSTVRTYAEKFSTLIWEGYGVTECSPVISVNTAFENRRGSVGRLIPGMQARLEPVPGVSEGGRLLVKGPNVMTGYLNQDANEAFQALGGWYDTGDIAMIDEDGFISILGRVKRFAKISGEMVSLTLVEDLLREKLSEFGEELELAVSAVHCQERGEALVLVTNEEQLKEDRIRQIIREEGVSNLCAPRSIFYMNELPRLGTGKIDYVGLRHVLEKNRENGAET